jgi:hypothetical protein
VADKVYDGTVLATITGRTLSGVIGSDDVSLSGGTAAFNDPNVGSGKAVTVSGLSLSGAAVTNYALASTTVSASASITPAGLTITANNTNKLFGQTIVFVGTEFTSAGLVSGDTVTNVALSSAGAVSTAAVGSYPIVAGSAQGAGLGNYTISYVNGMLTVVDLPGLSIRALPHGKGANQPTHTNSTAYVLTFQTVPAELYQIEYKTNVNDAAWTLLGSPVVGNGGSVSITNATAAPQSFFRVQIRQP